MLDFLVYRAAPALLLVVILLILLPSTSVTIQRFVTELLYRY